MVQYKKDLIGAVLVDCFYDGGEAFRGKPLGKNTIRKSFSDIFKLYVVILDCISLVARLKRIVPLFLSSEFRI